MKHKYKYNKKVYVMKAFYNNEGKYQESAIRKVKLYELPKEAVEGVDFVYDITTLFSSEEALVVAKKKKHISTYKILEGDPVFLQGLMNDLKSVDYEGYLCTVASIKGLKRVFKRSQRKETKEKYGFTN